MIKKMTKYSFVVFHKECDNFLNSLQTLGLVDVTRCNKAVDETSKAQFDKIAAYGNIIKILQGITEQSSHPVDIPQEQLFTEAETALARKAELAKKLSVATANYKAAAPWGEIEQSDLEKIAKMGYVPHFYICSEKGYKEEWEENFAIYKLGISGDKVYFVVLGNREESLAFPLAETQLTPKSASEYSAEIDSLNRAIEENNNRLCAIAEKAELLVVQKALLEDELDKYLATAQAGKEAEDSIVLFEGFAPTENDAQIEKLIEKESVYYIKEAATEEDNPPIKLKNNWFSRLYEPIVELYMLPKYGETDLTPYLAPFYMLFFGLCLGDMGYGLVMLLAGLYVNFKIPSYKGYGQLIAWLGVGSIIMPALNGTFFGAKIYELFSFPENISRHFFTDMKMFWFAIIFGIVQIVFARILNAILAMRAKGFLAGLHNIGWAVLIVWLSLLYSSSQVPFDLPVYVNYIGYAGLALILLFTSDNKNIFIKLFKGVSALYDITGVFGDMLSYIRLFGLGTAGGILGMVVNSVAMQLGDVPYLGWLFAGIMLILGHTMVLLLSALGAFVHPMRLTFVEFYKNTGFEGGGRAYNPLKSRVKGNK